MASSLTLSTVDATSRKERKPAFSMAEDRWEASCTTFPLNGMMASQRCCIVSSDGWIGVSEVDKEAM